MQAIKNQTILMTKKIAKDPVNARAAAIVAGGATRYLAHGPQPFGSTTLETAYMKKLLAVLVAGLFAAGAFAQAPATAPAPAPAAAPAAAAPAPVAKTKAAHTAKKKTGNKVAKKKTAHKAA